ncbi:MAG: Type 1 glutamine amidotransferase-like domain-containing protein [Gammaproteobacteria bacterium]
MKQIIAIGGGGFTAFQSELKIEKYLLSLVNKAKPKIGFLPQASNEDRAYVTKFYETFLALNAEPMWLSLFGRVHLNWERVLLEQDIIYVGGGNTKSMLALWQEWGVDKVLKQAYENGTVLSGISAGAICWFEQGVTDSTWPLSVINCLGFLTGSCCPHFDTEIEREPFYKEQVKQGSAVAGIALQDNTAAHFIDGKLHKIIKSVAHKKAFLLSADNQQELPCEAL